MKLIIALALAMPLFSFAQSERPLKKILATHSCELKIVKGPVIFAKEKNRTLSGNLVFDALEWSASLRRLKVNRTMKIHAVTTKQILMDDASIASVCVLDHATRKCSLSMEKMTVSQIEQNSGKNVKITCRKDSITDI